MRRLTIALMLLSSTALAQAPTFSSLTVNGPINGNGTINVSSGSSNAAINQGSTGLVWQMNLGAAASELRFVNSSGTKLLGVGTTNNDIEAASTINLSKPGAWSGSSLFSNTQMWMSTSLSGSYTGAASSAIPIFLRVASDSVTMPAGTGGGVAGIYENIGGSTMTGDRNTLDVAGNLTAATGNVAGTPLAAIRATTNAFSNDNGTSIAPAGAIWGVNNVAELHSGATYFSGVTGQETDIAADAGSSTQDKIGIHIVQLTGDAVQGTRDDIAFDLNNQRAIGAGAPGWKIGIGFGRQGGYWPMSPTGTLITAVPHLGGETMAVANGIDWSGVTFSGSAVKTPGFAVDGSGNVAAASYKAGATAGVSCAAGTVSLSTLVVTNGIITHC